MAVSDDTPHPQPGELLDGKYRIEKLLGSGAMGSVLRARHELRQVPVALKFMSADIVNKPGAVDRFLNEGVAASKIDCEHVVKVFDVSKLPNGVPYMVMEFLEGCDLKELLDRDGVLPVPRAIHFALQMMRGLQVAHRANVVHRDMKPANCFVIGKDGDPDFLKIVDFGISKVRQDDADYGADAPRITLTQAGAMLGTPLYMSLEQARSAKDVDARTDLYTSMAILYELLAGKPPFVPASGTLAELVAMLATEDPPPLDQLRSDLPPGLWTAIKKGLEKKREDRYQSATEMAEALAPFADERSAHVVASITRAPRAPGQDSRIIVSPLAAGEVLDNTATLVQLDKTPPSAKTPSSRGRVEQTERAATVEARPAFSLVSGTAEGTVRDAADGRRTPMWAIGLGAVALLAIGGWIWTVASAPEAPEPTIDLAAPRSAATQRAPRASDAAAPSATEVAAPSATVAPSAPSASSAPRAAFAPPPPRVPPPPPPPLRGTLKDIDPD